ncbi:hypothetical protein WR25_23814 isoform I [Diploscapter pachys]|uniref:Solute carrier family 40 member n=1 Tax=Diploscapter pachys TaxID=2018661 RepID=A0A2A2J8E8_9BILA|nr:hypothetical protein WR25_23814 isoform I [Diploscapter pachys]
MGLHHRHVHTPNRWNNVFGKCRINLIVFNSRYIATQQLADSIIKLIFTPIIGKILDKTNRNKGIQIALLINNFCVSISALVFAYCFHLLETTPDKKELQGHENIFLLIALIFSSMAKVASEIERMAFTKDWIVVLVQSSENSRLSAQNSIMNVLDQVSAALLPLFTGILLDTFSRIVCCVFVIVYNISSWIIESRILHTVYRDTPALKRRKSVDSEEIVEAQGNVSWIRSFKLYFNQKAWRPAFALAMLYFTVLSFDNLAISYGAKQGLSATALGTFMTAGSICGLLGNVSYTYFERCMGLLLTALIGFFLQNACAMTAGYSQVFFDSPLNITGYAENFELKSWPSRIISEIQSPSTRSDIIALPASQWPLSIILFFVGITFARYGLWIIDPTIIQIMQETIPERNRYRIFGVQASISEFFSMLKDIMVGLKKNPINFHVFSGHLVLPNGDLRCTLRRVCLFSKSSDDSLFHLLHKGISKFSQASQYSNII